MPLFLLHNELVSIDTLKKIAETSITNPNIRAMKSHIKDKVEAMLDYQSKKIVKVISDKTL
jgi:hypothetical protein